MLLLALSCSRRCYLLFNDTVSGAGGGQWFQKEGRGDSHTLTWMQHTQKVCDITLYSNVITQPILCTVKYVFKSIFSRLRRSAGAVGGIHLHQASDKVRGDSSLSRDQTLSEFREAAVSHDGQWCVDLLQDTRSHSQHTTSALSWGATWTVEHKSATSTAELPWWLPFLYPCTEVLSHPHPPPANWSPCLLWMWRWGAQ